MPYDEEEEKEAFPYTTIGTDDARRMIEAGAHVIDVRQPYEWNRGHIAEADLIPLNGIYSFGKALSDLKLADDEDVIFVCTSGQRSATASEIALVAGLKKVYNLANGMNGWVARRYPIER
ncbi:MAG TPA: rhodanese-like domain-containing protein [Ktedonobacteraceae bacterium]|nr:rhodanese-like domain-containing protein [Ktedonobacteraceae bacterium]